METVKIRKTFSREEEGEFLSVGQPLHPKPLDLSGPRSRLVSGGEGVDVVERRAFERKIKFRHTCSAEGEDFPSISIEI